MEPKDSMMEMFATMRNCFDENIYLINLTENTCIFSDKIANLFGFTDVYVSNALKTIENLVYDSDKALFLSVLRPLLAKKRKNFMLDHRIIDKDGNIVRINNKGDLLDGIDDKSDFLIGRIILGAGSSLVDELTGCKIYENCIQDYESTLRREGRLSGYLMKLNVDNMNAINERMGKDIGDKVLKTVAKCARDAVPKETVIYRGKEDEFLILNLTGDSAICAEKVFSNIKRHITESEHEIDYKVIFTVSAGLVAFVSSNTPFGDLMQRINFTLQSVKEHGKNAMKTYNFEEYKRHLARYDLQENLRLSVKNNYEGFQLYFQPVVDATEINLNDTSNLEKTPVLGAEALLRWVHPKTKKMFGAGEVIPVLEDCGLIIPLGRWILLTACNQCKAWNKYKPHFRMSINLSYIQIEKSNLILDVQIALEKSGVNPRNIVLEITESGSIATEELISFCKKLKDLNVGIDIDDFGTGYSNMRYLQEMNADTLKLDYSMIEKAVNAAPNSKDKVVVDHITKLAKDLDMKICMEGIEKREYVDELIGLKPDKFQGFYFSKPIDASSFEKKYKFNPVDIDTFNDENFSKDITNVD